MNWYIAKLVYRVTCGNGKHNAQFEEQLRIIEAPGPKAAFRRARRIGMEEGNTGSVQQMKPVSWQFIDVCELYKLSKCIDGAELGSTMHEAESPEVYIEKIHRKAAQIQRNTLESMLEIY